MTCLNYDWILKWALIRYSRPIRMSAQACRGIGEPWQRLLIDDMVLAQRDFAAKLGYPTNSYKVSLPQFTTREEQSVAFNFTYFLWLLSYSSVSNAHERSGWVYIGSNIFR